MFALQKMKLVAYKFHHLCCITKIFLLSCLSQIKTTLDPKTVIIVPYFVHFPSYHSVPIF